MPRKGENIYKRKDGKVGILKDIFQWERPFMAIFMLIHTEM